MNGTVEFCSVATILNINVKYSILLPVFLLLPLLPQRDLPNAIVAKPASMISMLRPVAVGSVNMIVLGKNCYLSRQQNAYVHSVGPSELQRSFRTGVLPFSKGPVAITCTVVPCFRSNSPGL